MMTESFVDNALQLLKDLIAVDSVNPSLRKTRTCPGVPP
jgi:hypothetical protein